MPTYEYACKACGHEFEREQRITDDPIRTCPKCRKRQVQRLISQTAFVLKGGGWYSDLYASRKPKDAEKSGAADKGDKADKGAQGASKGDAGGAKGDSAPSGSSKGGSGEKKASAGRG